MQRNDTLRRLRIQHDWRLADLADQIGTTETTVKRWERGSQQPSVYYRVKLCELFGLSAQELGFETELPRPSQLLESEKDAAFHSEDRAQHTALWTVPYARNPHFTGRDNVLTLLDQRLNISQSRDNHPFAFTQVHAITGLGGIGKTQIALEYAYRSLAQERYQSTLWLTATDEEALLTSFTGLTDLLPFLRLHEETDHHRLATAIIRWLEQCEPSWLLIFDNVDDPSFLQPYVPRRGNGSILLTTRAKAVGSFASSIEVDTMPVEESIQLLLQRAQRSDNAPEQDLNHARTLALALGQFPLALDQAGAYLEETGCSFDDYLQMYQQDHFTLLARRGMQMTGYPASVNTTWSLSFQRVEQLNPAAADVLRLCALLAPDHIPLELLTEGALHWPAPLRQAIVDPAGLNTIMAELLRFSLIKRVPQDRLLSIHRLVQIVQLQRMSPQEQRQWAERIVRAIHTIFPPDPTDKTASWNLCQRYLEQALACSAQIHHQQFSFPEAADVLERTGIYLRERASYVLAEPLFRQALSLREQQERPPSAALASGLNHLANLHYKQGTYEQAESLYQQALDVGEQLMGPHLSLICASCNGLATLYREQGKYTQAEQLYQRALGIWAQQGEPESYETLTSCNGLATLYREQGKYAQAEPLFLRALRLGEHYLEPDHVDLGSILNDLANLYLQQGKYADAEPLYQRACRIWEEQRGADHPWVAYVLNNLALLYAEQGKYTQAESFCQHALRIWEQRGEQDHPQMSYPLSNLANIYTKTGKSTQAEPLCQQVLLILEQMGEPHHPQMVYPLNILATIYLQHGKLEQAERTCQQAMLILERQGTRSHPLRAAVLHRFALLSSQQGKETEAASFYQQSLHLYEHQFGPEHVKIAPLLHDFADFQYAHGLIQEAIDLYQRAALIREQVFGAEHPQTRLSRTCLDALLRRLDDPSELRGGPSSLH